MASLFRRMKRRSTSATRASRPVLMAYPVKEDGTLGEGKTLLDARQMMPAAAAASTA